MPLGKALLIPFSPFQPCLAVGCRNRLTFVIPHCKQSSKQVTFYLWYLIEGRRHFSFIFLPEAKGKADKRKKDIAMMSSPAYKSCNLMLYSSSFQFDERPSIIWRSARRSDIVTWLVGEYCSGNRVVPNISKMFINLSSCFIFCFL